ncbi:nitroreductase family deazaflavin-dependent oxidoreductase [Yinghuangia sp. ASG 101]|uniref:nitroreductase family deazaflavin-dependent oxidoreductase n=1 Tax=Yinghuangia sp. ASG 101 TaxID=2896848 RepID=UPI001E4FE37D|nr:nitroreductase family deazaflavin-dependent oxidoreductase [Yinghuangia sp. ASG 101]UGQ12161.1 nitroreductase family deazaflavin-dependent oxidoreductase [Yinghuangia sp. ASG 101]
MTLTPRRPAGGAPAVRICLAASGAAGVAWIVTRALAGAGTAQRDGRAPRAIMLRAVRGAGMNDHFLRAVSAIAPSVDRTAYRLTGGRMLLMPALLPSLMLTTTGRRSGRPRQVPLLCRPEDDGTLLIVASNCGRPHHPAWSDNLLAEPRATVTRFGRTTNVTAVLLDGPERTAAWEAMARLWPAYEKYAGKCTRHLRVFRLVPT